MNAASTAAAANNNVTGSSSSLAIVKPTWPPEPVPAVAAIAVPDHSAQQGTEVPLPATPARPHHWPASPQEASPAGFADGG